MAVEINKELFQTKINELGVQVGLIRETVGALKRVEDIEGEGEAYETLKGATEHFANNLDTQLVTMLTNIHTNLQTILNDFDTKEKEIQQLIQQDAQNVGGAQ